MADQTGRPGRARKYLRTHEAAVILDVGDTLVRTWFDTGVLDGRRLPPADGSDNPGQRQITPESVDALLEKMKQGDRP